MSDRARPSDIPGVPRESYAEISLYAPPRVPADIDLSDNTNQWGAPPSLARSLAAIDPVELTQYPSQPMVALERALARYVGIDDTDAIVTGCGSDDVLDCIMRAFAAPGERVVHAQPTFSMIPYFARTNGIASVAVPYREDWDIDVEAMLATRARITYLCAPNNPTGTMIPATSIRRILDNVEGVVVLDEAYAEFARESWAARAPREGRLIVTRTLSKAFGLAGMRIGYAVGAPALMHEIAKARGPYKVSVVAERLALGVLESDVEWVRRRADEAIDARRWLERALRELGLAPLPSEGNFLLVPFEGAAACAAALAGQRILVRAFTALPGVGDALRIGVAPLEQLDRAVQALRAFMAGNA